MRGLVRLLIMFGPMIMRQVSKYQRNKQRQQPQQRQQYPQQQRGLEQPGGRRGAPQQQPQQKVYKDLNKELGRDGRGRAVSAEERDFNLKEEEIMLNKEDLKHYEANYKKVEELDDVSLDSVIDKTKGSKKQVEDDSDYDEFFES